MSTLTAPLAATDPALVIEQEIRVQASLETTFAALLEQLGPAFSAPDGTPLQFKLEAFPGGRWYRDLGNHNGHCWATVQAIKRPTLLEFSGPLMMSAAVINNVQYRLSHDGGVTLIKFHHYGFGVISAENRKNMPDGWKMIHEAVKQRAEGGKK